MADESFNALVEAMLARRTVIAMADMTNGSGELIKAAGWRTVIREIRRPALDANAYGHLDPVVVVEEDLDDPQRSPGLSICLRPAQVAVAVPAEHAPDPAGQAADVAGSHDPRRRVRDEVLASARDAHTAMDRAKAAFTAPYSTADQAREFHQATGYWQGLFKAVEVIDALTAPAASTGADRG